MNEGLLDRYAELIVGFGANVQPDQVVAVEASPEAAPLVHRIARLAYERGARYVDVVYFDPQMKRIRIETAAEDSLSWVPPWLGRRILDLGRLGAARIVLSPIVPPGMLAGLDPGRAARDRLPGLPEVLKAVDERSIAWSISPFPTEAWAKMVFPDLAPATAVDALWRDIENVCRLDERDPVAAWQRRIRDLGDGIPPRRPRPRHPSIRRTRHRPDGRPTSQLTVRQGGRPRDDTGRHPACAEPPHRGALHDPGSRADGRCRGRDQAARRQRLARDRPADPLRRWPGGRDRGRRERAGSARALRHRRGRRPARRGRTRRRREPHRPARPDLLQHPARREFRKPPRPR